MSLNLNSSSVNFKANAANDQGYPYYKSNKGTIAGAVLAVPAVYMNIKPAFKNVDELVNKADESYKKIVDMYKGMGIPEEEVNIMMPKNYKEILARKKKFAIPFAIVAGVCTLGAGMLYDKKRNQKASEAATDLAQGNYNNIYANGGEVDISKAGLPYYKSNNGVKFGAATGALCGVVRGAMKCIQNKKFRVAELLFPAACFTLGGMMMASIAQGAANKASEKSTY